MNLPRLIPRLAAESIEQYREAGTLHYRLRSRWLKLRTGIELPNQERILVHMMLFGCAPGFVITTDELDELRGVEEAAA